MSVSNIIACPGSLITVVARKPFPNGYQRAWPIRPFSSSTPFQALTVAQARRRYRDPYVRAQVKARKDANLTRQAALQKQRIQALGDPVRGVTTPFVRSFDTASVLPSQEKGITPYLNHYLRQDEIDSQLQESNELLTPIPKLVTAHNRPQNMPIEDYAAQLKKENADASKRHVKGHEVAQEAFGRLFGLEKGSAKDRKRVNIQRCIHTFGRHETDMILPPKPKATPLHLFRSQDAGASIRHDSAKDKEPRGDVIARNGPDTGSSEVQIAILTAKIRSLANALEQPKGKKDKVGKRDMRLLVHRRQKLLQYLKRKERAGPRWQRCIRMLGLAEGTWKGEITL